MHSWREENEHAEKLIEYVILRGGTPVIPMIPVRKKFILQQNEIIKTEKSN